MMLHSYFIRRFNEKSLSAKRAKIEDKEKRDKCQRTKDKERILGFADHMDEVHSRLEVLEKEATYRERFSGVLADLMSTTNKTSADEHEKKVGKFKRLQRSSVR